MNQLIAFALMALGLGFIVPIVQGLASQYLPAEFAGNNATLTGRAFNALLLGAIIAVGVYLTFRVLEALNVRAPLK